MNVYDSDQMRAGLAASGYRHVASPENADLILVNTCTIRAKAEQKAFSFLGRMADLKRTNPHLIIGVTGCVAQQEGQKIFKRMPHVDLVAGTQAIARLPGMIKKIESKRCRLVDVSLDKGLALETELPVSKTAADVTRFVTIMTGCDNYCSYCVVPYVRGRETSRPPDEIIQEIERLVSSGVREVTLLGQNVNSYGRKEHFGTFADLLQQIDAIDGLRRIRFTTSHPKDLSEDLMRSFALLPKLCRHIHLPVQSGSDSVLKRMNRKYTVEKYLNSVSRLRHWCPEIEITTDIIVGFPGETERDFAATVDLIQKVGYESLFVFNYSDRPQTPASKFKAKVSETTSSQRLQTVLKIQETITRARNETMIGSRQDVLVEGFSKRQSLAVNGGHAEDVAWRGRTGGQKIVNFGCANKSMEDRMRPGRLVRVEIERALAHSLWGTVHSFVDRSGALRGERNYAA